MNKNFTLFLILFFSFCIAQNKRCELTFQIDTSKINQEGNVYLKIENIGNKKAKIVKNFDDLKVQILNAYVFSKENNQYIPLNFTFADIDFFFPEKTENLKPKKNKTYKINILKTYQGKNLTLNNKYKFDLNFNFYDFSNCGLKGLYEIKNIEYIRK